MVIDFGEQLERLLESKVGLLTILQEYYIPFIPWINGILFPLYALISVIFFTSRLAANTEILPIFNAGVSFKRLMVPYLFSASILALILLWTNHYLIPQSNKSRLGFRNEYISSKKQILRSRNMHIFLDPNRKVYINYYNKKDSTGHDFRLEQFEQKKLISVLKAKKIKLIQSPNRWRLSNYQQLNLIEGQEQLSFGNKEYIDTTLSLEHEDFVRFSNENDMLTSSELQRYMAKEKERGLGNARAMAVAYHRRNAEPVSILILTIIGMALSARKKGEG